MSMEESGPPSGQFGGPAPAGRLAPGTAVEVRARFDGRWSRGFVVEVVEEVVTAGTARVAYRVRRTSDGQVLPALFLVEEVTPAS